MRTEMLDALGYDVATCRGPGPGEVCPLLSDGDCRVARDADAIFSSLPICDGVAIANAAARAYPDVAVIVEAPRAHAASFPTADRIVRFPARESEIRAALAAVLPD
jgi:hypothetical protein